MRVPIFLHPKALVSVCLSIAPVLVGIKWHLITAFHVIFPGDVSHPIEYLYVYFEDSTPWHN